LEVEQGELERVVWLVQEKTQLWAQHLQEDAAGVGPRALLVLPHYHLVKHAGQSLHQNLNPVVEVVATVFCDEGQDTWVGANWILPLMGMEVEVAFEWVCLGPLSAVNNWVTSLYRARVLVDIH
jgi:hypothetical protein